MRAYISHTTENYEHITINLAKSINRYSVYPLIVYTVDYEASSALKSVAICKRLDLNLPKADSTDFVEFEGINYVNRGTYRTYMTLSAKIDCMIDAVESGIEEWVYLDADCIANTNIDEMFEYAKDVKEYPLATLGPQEYVLLVENGKFIGDPFWKEDGSTDNTQCLEWKLMEFFNMKPEDRTSNYRTTNILVGTNRVGDFLRTWRDAKNIFPKLFDTYKALPFHEETLYNVLVWQRGDQHLPMVYINIQGAHTVQHFVDTSVDEDTFIGEFYKLPADKNQIKVFHGEKRPEEIEKIFNILGEPKRRLKILFLAPHLSTGGMPAFLLRRIQMLKKWTNHEIFVAEWTLYSGIYTVQRNEILKLIPQENFINLGYLGETTEMHKANRRRIIDYCLEKQIDIIHIDEIPEGFDDFSIFPIEIQRELYGDDKPWRIVETCHNVWFDPKKLKKAEPDAYATVVHRHIEETFKGRGVKTELIQFPTDRPFDGVLLSREEILKEFGFKSKGEYHIVNIGLWTHGKNQKYAIEIARYLYNYYGHTYQFHFVGNQAPNFYDYWSPLMNDLPPNCHVHGERDDSWKFLIMADVMLFTSTWECNPIVLAEAAAYNCKTMAYNLPQYGEYWSDKITHLSGDLKTDSDNLIVECGLDKSFLKKLNGLDGHRFAMQHNKLYNDLIESPKYRRPSTLMLNERCSITLNNNLKFVNLHENPCSVEFWDQDTKRLEYMVESLQTNHWCMPSIEYFVNWKVIIKWPDRSYEWVVDLEDKIAYIEIGSSSLGDTLAFVEVIRQWCIERKLKKCYLMTYKNFLFDWDDYAKDNIFPSYPGTPYPEHDVRFYVGVHMGDRGVGQPWYPNRNKRDWRKIYLGDVAADAIGYNGQTEVRPVLAVKKSERPVAEKYIVIATQSTAQAKYWNNPTGWQDLVDWHIAQGYKVFLASGEPDGYMGNFYPTGVEKLPQPLDEVINYLHHAEYFIGISSGLSWLAWAVNIPVVLISGFTPEVCEFTDKTLRIINKSVCNSCWEWEHFDKGNWRWCPTNKNFECSSTITSEYVINQIKNWNK